MARKITTTISDDIDGTPDAQSTTFGFQGVAYSIDLSSKNKERLTKALAPYIASASRQPGATPRSAARATDRGYDLAALREWAGKNKVALPKRGRIPALVVAQYRAAGGQ